ncbi:MAG TPA: hypothetical protein PK299_03205 [Anaerolineales bacterium]|nr:hypothetical protein [Anaerolineales bacterium]
MKKCSAFATLPLPKQHPAPQNTGGVVEMAGHFGVGGNVESNGFNVELLRRSRNALRLYYGFGVNRLKISSFSRLNPQKHLNISLFRVPNGLPRYFTPNCGEFSVFRLQKTIFDKVAEQSNAMPCVTMPEQFLLKKWNQASRNQSDWHFHWLWLIVG